MRQVVHVELGFGVRFAASSARFTSTASEELKGSKWTLLTDGGDTTFLLPSSVQGVRTIQLGGISVPKSSRDGGWMHLLDSVRWWWTVSPGILWRVRQNSERASHLDPAWSRFFGLGR